MREKDFSRKGDSLYDRLVPRISSSWVFDGIGFRRKRKGHPFHFENLLMRNGKQASSSFGKPVCGLLGFLFCSLLSFGAETASGISESGMIDQAQKRLLNGVEKIGLAPGALAGNVLILDQKTVFPLCYCNTDGVDGFAAVGGFYGKGRFFYFAHVGFFGLPFSADNKRLCENLFPWLSRDKANPRVALLRCPDVAPFVRAVLGDEAVCTVLQNAENLRVQDYDICLSRGIEKGEVEGFCRYVEEGGGVLLASLGWGYMFYHPNDSFAEDFADNRFLATMGCLATDYSVGRIGDAFPSVFSKPVPDGIFIDDALAFAKAGTYPPGDGRKLVLKGISDVMNALPQGVHKETEQRLAEGLGSSEAEMLPSPEHPLSSDAFAARRAILVHKNKWLGNCEMVWPAHPAAKVYPGLAKEDAPTIERTIEVDLRIPKWHSTGVFSPAGKPLTVEVDAQDVELGLEIRIGTTGDNLSNKPEWRRAPVVSANIPVSKTKMVFSSPFGGLVYIVVPQHRKMPEKIVSVKLSGGIMAPWFKRGRDTNEKFIRECAETGAPWGEIEGENLIVTSETIGLKKVQDPEWIARFWDEALDSAQELAQIDEKRRFPERFCSDVQLIAGWLHNGYPLMSHINSAHFDGYLDKETLVRVGDWGVFHEIGHNHQSGHWTPEGATEVTVNLFTCHAIETVVGDDCRSNRYVSSREQGAKRVRNWVARGKRFEDWKNQYFLALEMYMRLKDAYGWETFKKVFRRYRQPGFALPRNNDEKWQIFARTFSEECGHNVAAALAEWSIPISRETLDACAKYPAADPCITQDLVQPSGE